MLGISEACLVALAFIAATLARLGANDAVVMLNYEQGFVKIGVISAAFVTCMYYFDLYDSSILGNRREILTRLIQVLGTVCVFWAVLYYFYPRWELGRGIFLMGVIIVGVVLLFWRRLFLLINSQTEFGERVLIFGDGPLANPLIREIEARPEVGLRVVSQFVASNDATSKGRIENNVVDEDIQRAVKINRVNRVLIALGDRRGRLPVESLLSLKSCGIKIQDGTDVYEAVTGKVPIESLRLGWLLFSPGFCISRFLRTYKRTASILISGIGLLVSMPVIPVVALLIKISSRGPIFYKQLRVGRDGKTFECYKFRTMRADAEADSGPTWAGDDDPRITPVGRFLRICRIDEIPQLWNVMKGDMSLVGPRPERPEFVEILGHEIPHYHLRHSVRPGITGWAQIRFRYGSSIEDSKEKLRYDLFYIKNISPGLDFLIFVQTIKTILLGRGAQ